MVNEVSVGRIGLAAAFASNFAIAGVAFALYKDGTTRGAQYSYVQPDDKTFGIWSLIYALHLLLVAAQICCVSAPGFAEARPWLAFNYISNGSWLLVNGAGNAGFSYWLAVLVLWLNLYSLVQAYRALDIDYTNRKVSPIAKLCLYAPVSCNLSWVVLAAAVNLSNTLYNPNDPSSVAIGGPDWAIAVVGLATALACSLAVTRLDLGYAFIAVWAFLGVHRNQTGTGDGPLAASPELDTMAISCCVVVPVACLLGAALHICCPTTRALGGTAEERTSLRMQLPELRSPQTPLLVRHSRA